MYNNKNAENIWKNTKKISVLYTTFREYLKRLQLMIMLEYNLITGHARAG